MRNFVDLQYHLTFEVCSILTSNVRRYFSPLQNVNKHKEQSLGTLAVTQCVKVDCDVPYPTYDVFFWALIHGDLPQKS